MPKKFVKSVHLFGFITKRLDNRVYESKRATSFDLIFVIVKLITIRKTTHTHTHTEEDNLQVVRLLQFPFLRRLDPNPGLGHHLRGFTVTIRHSTLGRTPLEE